MVDTFTYQIARDTNIDTTLRIFSYRNGVEAWNYGTQIVKAGEVAVTVETPGRGDLEFALQQKFPGCEITYKPDGKVNKIAGIKLPAINAQWTGKQWTEELEIVRNEYPIGDDGAWAVDLIVVLK